MLGDRDATRDAFADEDPFPPPARPKGDHPVGANGTLEERVRRAAAENGRGGSPLVVHESPQNVNALPDMAPGKEGGQEGEGESAQTLQRGGSGRFDKRGARQFGAPGRVDNGDPPRGEVAVGGTRGEQVQARQVEVERVIRKAHTAAESEVGGGVFKAPANIVRTVKRPEEGNGHGGFVRPRPRVHEKAPAADGRANAAEWGEGKGSPRGGGDYTETGNEEFRALAYPHPIAVATALEVSNGGIEKSAMA
jgi:hypothetical protein